MTNCECLASVWVVLLLRPYLEKCRHAVRIYHDTSKWISNVTDSTGKIAHSRLRLSGLELDVVHRARSKHQATKLRPCSILSVLKAQLKINGKEEIPIENDIPVVSITPSNAHEIEEVSCMYLPDDVRESYNPGVRLPEVYSFAKTTEKDDKNRPITAHKFINEQEIDSYCRQARSTVGLEDRCTTKRGTNS